MTTPDDGRTRVGTVRRKLNPAFAGMTDERDPLVGQHGGSSDNFTIPAHPLRRRVVGMRQFVTTRGGEYFFLPGLRALSYLAESS